MQERLRKNAEGMTKLAQCRTLLAEILQPERMEDNDEEWREPRRSLRRGIVAATVPCSGRALLRSLLALPCLPKA